MEDLRADIIETGSFDNMVNTKMVEFINTYENHELWDLGCLVMIRKFADELKKELNGGR